jgi:hypothetical protein
MRGHSVLTSELGYRGCLYGRLYDAICPDGGDLLRYAKRMLAAAFDETLNCVQLFISELEVLKSKHRVQQH